MSPITNLLTTLLTLLLTLIPLTTAVPGITGSPAKTDVEGAANECYYPEYNAQLGHYCSQPGLYRCTCDYTSIAVCTLQNVWILNNVCDNGGCLIIGEQVYCIEF